MLNDQPRGPSGALNSGGEKGGPWGQGPRRPWGQPQPPTPRGGRDLEDMIRDLRERFNFGGGGGGGGTRGGPGRMIGWPLFAALLLFGWIASGIYIVDEGQRAVITRFGAFNRVTMPGLHMHLPPPIEGHRTILFSRQQILQVGYQVENNQTIDIPEESSMITGDRNIVDVEFRVIYTLRADSASAAYDYAFALRDPQQAIKAVAESAMREVIGQRRLESILTTDRAAIEQAVEELAQRVLDSYNSGVDVAEVNLLASRPPQPVVEAFNEVLRAGQDAQAEINRATQYQTEQVPRAQGTAAQIVQQAEGYRQQVVHEAQGDASRFTQIESEYRRAPAVTRQRLYLETMERLYARANTIILDQRSGTVTYLPLDQLRRPIITPQTATPPAGGH